MEGKEPRRTPRSGPPFLRVVAVTGWFGGGKRRREDDDDKDDAARPKAKAKIGDG